MLSPEHRLGADSSLSTVASVTEVVVSGDLQVAKVFVSFFGDARGAEVAFAGLQRLEGYLRSHVGKAMQLRFVPELRFIRDEGAARGDRVMSLLSGLRAVTDADEARQQSESDGDSSGSDVELVTYDSEDDIIGVQHT